MVPTKKKHAFAMSLGHLGTSHCVSPGREGGGGGGGFFFFGGSPGFEGEKRGISRRQQWGREGRGREDHKEYYRAIEEIW